MVRYGQSNNRPAEKRTGDRTWCVLSIISRASEDSDTTLQFDSAVTIASALPSRSHAFGGGGKLTSLDQSDRRDESGRPMKSPLSSAEVWHSN